MSSWFRSREGAFGHFGGVTREVLIYNSRPVVVEHDAATREVDAARKLLQLPESATAVVEWHDRG